jgi:hypothetical protein
MLHSRNARSIPAPVAPTHPFNESPEGSPPPSPDVTPPGSPRFLFPSPHQPSPIIAEVDDEDNDSLDQQEVINDIERPQTRGPNLDWFEFDSCDTKAEVDQFVLENRLSKGKTIHSVTLTLSLTLTPNPYP